MRLNIVRSAMVYADIMRRLKQKTIGFQDGNERARTDLDSQNRRTDHRKLMRKQQCTRWRRRRSIIAKASRRINRIFSRGLQ